MGEHIEMGEKLLKVQFTGLRAQGYGNHRRLELDDVEEYTHYMFSQCAPYNQDQCIANLAAASSMEGAGQGYQRNERAQDPGCYDCIWDLRTQYVMVDMLDQLSLLPHQSLPVQTLMTAFLSALFAQINQGESITHALKHVSHDMKTHKNLALKAQSGPVRSGPKPFSVAKLQSNPSSKPATKKEPALLELEGKKWRVENVSNLVINDTELKQVVYIYKCVNTTLEIKGKINSITLDNCKKLGLVFDDVVGIVEIINSRDVKVQVMGKVPTISINKTDGCHAYLSKNSLDCEIVSAKSSEMNVLIPTDGGDFNEFSVPEQFKTLWNGQKLVTTVTEIAG
ncbi:LOW QUALITY PROTEIN: adenylyl cyclase-associated protein 1-like [Perognathus longimembris pacificus]|uniref:LOW QUALITY PROTEIN: adenylyl cyclase-associated protein 1-like n=1 Tax=Perognathus longimembris pacificus TaxID=214514 RepID=UPI002019448E|nr:LOW QUALITY PROTEIN: adenylyl cyclase-associated protein 1-like [Perognathus longimembris pacificus]